MASVCGVIWVGFLERSIAAQPVVGALGATLVGAIAFGAITIGGISYSLYSIYKEAFGEDLKEKSLSASLI